MGAGVDPHLYDPTPGDARRLKNARVVFYSGLHLEGKMSGMLEDLARKKPTVALTSKLAPADLRKDKHGHTDPHVWFNAKLWAATPDVVAETLASFDLSHAGDYRANAKKYRDKLLALHEEVRKELEALPEDKRILVTAHDAFHYFGDAYGVDVKAVQGVSTESKAGLKEIEDLVEFLTKHRIKAVFFESSVSDKNIRSLQEGCQARGHTIAIGGELFS